MEFELKQFEKWAVWFCDFCRRMDQGKISPISKVDFEGLLSVNLHMLMALGQLKSDRGENL